MRTTISDAKIIATASWSKMLDSSKRALREVYKWLGVSSFYENGERDLKAGLKRYAIEKKILQLNPP